MSIFSLLLPTLLLLWPLASIAVAMLLPLHHNVDAVTPALLAALICCCQLIAIETKQQTLPCHHNYASIERTLIEDFSFILLHLVVTTVGNVSAPQ